MTMTIDSRRVALVTGGTTGIGFATARVLHEQNYAVVVTGENPDRIATARNALSPDVVVLRADARVVADAQAVADEIRTRYGRLDAVFLNAGTGPMQAIDAVDEASFDNTFAVNVKGPFFTLQKVLPLLQERASVVLMTAQGVWIGAPSYSVPTASRGAMMAFVAPLAVELAPRRIRVNAVSPAAIDTPALGKLGLAPEQLAAFGTWVEGRLLVKRIGTPEDVARVVAFLLSEDAGFINGACIPIDGGMGVSM